MNKIFKAYPRQSMEFSFHNFVVALKHILFGSQYSFVKDFEDAFAEYIGVKYAESFFSARAAMYFVLKSLEFERDAEIIVPAYTFFSVPDMVVLAGFKPDFVDADQEASNINLDLIEKAITEKTRVIIVTHMHGQPANMTKIMEIADKYNLRVIEDCAHSCGAKIQNKWVGSYDIGCFSFGRGKNLTALLGGMVTTNDEKFSLKLKDIKKEFGEVTKQELIKTVLKGYLMRILTYPRIYFFLVYPLVYLSYVFNLGLFNKFLDDDRKLSTAVPDDFKKQFPVALAKFAFEQLKTLEYRNDILKTNAKVLFKDLNNVKFLKLQKVLSQADGIYYHFAVRVSDKEKFIRYMALRGVDIQKDYCSPCPYLDIFEKFKNDCPVSREISSDMVYIPTHPSLTQRDMRYILKEIQKYYNS